MPESPSPLTAILWVDATAGGQIFSGVWLETSSGERWVVDYQARDCWRPFDEQVVTVTGERYMPDGLAVDAPHFRVETLRIEGAAAETAAAVALGPEQTWAGAVAEVQGEPGSKSEGTAWLVLRTAGQDWQVPQAAVAAYRGQAVVVTGRPIERSPYAAHSGGPALCILSIAPAP